jgi:hypothetical protein
MKKDYLKRKEFLQTAGLGAVSTYIFNHGSTHELYDHEADPGEFVNRIDDSALKKVQNQLHDRLFAWYNPNKNPYRPA